MPLSSLYPIVGLVVGLIVGLAALYLSRWVNGNLRDRAIGGAVAAAVGVVIGFIFIFSDIWVGGSSANQLPTSAL